MIRKVLNDTITTVAGTGSNVGGYSGDGGQATSAELNRPTGVAFDARGNLYIADGGNNVIRKVIYCSIPWSFGKKLNDAVVSVLAV